ncbi:hypothetical protein T10_10043 [Trichinella papuae]|uniref:Uncharacterized protein n=1 Tax=Trichinella papuae TaxID=268474 RepID=A0A0V1MF75_9BILA|nr:hypothetical protein T10_10043 [Trichinella papuae]
MVSDSGHQHSPTSAAPQEKQTQLTEMLQLALLLSTSSTSSVPSCGHFHRLDSQGEHDRLMLRFAVSLSRNAQDPFYDNGAVGE